MSSARRRWVCTSEVVFQPLLTDTSVAVVVSSCVVQDAGRALAVSGFPTALFCQTLHICVRVGFLGELPFVIATHVSRNSVEALFCRVLVAMLDKFKARSRLDDSRHVVMFLQS